jgi:hypothetical protein
MPKATRLRKSHTDGMQSDTEKLMSGCERQLITILDSDTDTDQLRKLWPEHPTSCVVVVAGTKGHFNYICNIAPRLEALGFVMEPPFPHRPKVPGQQSVAQEAAMKHRQAAEDAALTTEQHDRIERNKHRALEIRAQEAA